MTDLLEKDQTLEEATWWPEVPEGTPVTKLPPGVYVERCAVEEVLEEVFKPHRKPRIQLSGILGRATRRAGK